MNFLKYILIFCLCSFASYADQNDKRLNDLFRILAYSEDVREINSVTAIIWDIWLETNDPLITIDFEKGLQSMKNGQLKESIKIFTKVIKNKPNFA